MITASTQVEPAARRRIGGVAAWPALGAALVVVLAVAAFAVGHSRAAGPQTLHGQARVGEHQATILVGDWAYGIQGSVPWIDLSGALHDGGWPSCLAPVGALVPVSFQAVDVTAPDGESWRAVTWLDCRG